MRKRSLLYRDNKIISRYHEIKNNNPWPFQASVALAPLMFLGFFCFFFDIPHLSEAFGIALRIQT